MAVHNFVPTLFPLVNVVEEKDPATGQVRQVGYVTQPWRRFQEGVGIATTPGSSGEVLTSNGAALVWQKLVNANIAVGAAIAYAKLNLATSILDADIAALAAIAWSKISKAGSSLADLTTRSASDLNAGTVPHARKWTQATTILTGNQDDVTFSSADAFVANNASLLTVRGLAAGVAAQHLTIFAINAQVDLANQDVGSAAGNRIITGTGATVSLAAGTGRALLAYESVSARWRVVSAA